jgi:cytochrome c oxidase subunit II
MNKIKSLFLAIGLVASPLVAMAQAPAVVAPAAPVVATPAATTPAPAAKADVAKKVETTIGTSKADATIGQPIAGKIGLQPQVTALGERAAWLHDYPIQILMFVMSAFVLFLLFWVAIRFNRKSNPVPSKTSHNTLIEIVWTLVPVLILVGLAIPSIILLSDQFKPAPKNAITLKAIGNQWLWVHDYPDLGVEITSNMLPDDEAKAKGEPRLLGVDNRIVLPVNTPIRLLTTSNDVIHAWAIPAFWIKMDAVPGRINETSFTVEKPGVYYGQCSELCGIKHGFMPIAVEVVSKADFATWVRAKGGAMPEDKKPEPVAAAPAAAAPAAPVAVVPAAPAASAAAPK